jgi:hypothetical protein
LDRRIFVPAHCSRTPFHGSLSPDTGSQALAAIIGRLQPRTGRLSSPIGNLALPSERAAAEQTSIGGMRLSRRWCARNPCGRVAAFATAAERPAAQPLIWRTPPHAPIALEHGARLIAVCLHAVEALGGFKMGT